MKENQKRCKNAELLVLAKFRMALQLFTRGSIDTLESFINLLVSSKKSAAIDQAVATALEASRAEAGFLGRLLG